MAGLIGIIETARPVAMLPRQAAEALEAADPLLPAA